MKIDEEKIAKGQMKYVIHLMELTKQSTLEKVQKLIDKFMSERLSKANKKNKYYIELYWDDLVKLKSKLRI
ncbi:hypothetical protein CCP1ISM_60031 [Azospirillaceae bacterium]